MSTKSGEQLRNHIKLLTKHIIDNGSDLSKPNSFERISHEVKNSVLRFERETSSTGAPQRPIIGNKLINEIIPANTAQKLNVRVEDIDEKFKVLAATGRSISRVEILTLKNAIFKLATDHKVSEISYFGKLIGLNRDLHVFWALRDNEVARTSINFIDFFVSIDLKSWIKLPDIGPVDIRASRQWKKFWDFEFDSNFLNTDQCAQKRLKALLARALFSNKICPESFLVPGESDEDIPVRDAEFVFQGDRLETTESWIHELPYILKYGDLTHPDFGFDEIKEKLEKGDSAVPRLSKITEDKRKWNVRIFDEKTPISSFERENDQGQAQKTVIFTNDLWPECVNYYSDARKCFGLFFVGFGLKSNINPLPKSILPIQPEKVNDKLVEQKEPNPEDEALVIETDSEPEPASDHDSA